MEPAAFLAVFALSLANVVAVSVLALRCLIASLEESYTILCDILGVQIFTRDSGTEDHRMDALHRWDTDASAVIFKHFDIERNMSTRILMKVLGRWYMALIFA